MDVESLQTLGRNAVTSSRGLKTLSYVLDNYDLTDEDKQAIRDAYIEEQKLQGVRQQYGVEQLPSRGLMGEAAHSFGRMITDTAPRAAAQMIQGKNVPAEGQGGFLERFIQGQDQDLAAEPPSREYVLEKPGHRSIVEGIEGGGASLPVALGGFAAGAGAAAAVPADPATRVAVGAATAAAVAGAGMYRQATNEFLRQVRDSIPGLSENDWEVLKAQIDKDATAYGLWEAGPEAVSEGIEYLLFKAPVGKLLGRVLGPAQKSRIWNNVATRLAGRYAGMLTAEIPSEAATEVGQSRLLSKYTDETAASPGEALRRVAGPTAVTTAMLGLGFGGANVIDNRLRQIRARRSNILKDAEDLQKIEDQDGPLSDEADQQNQKILENAAASTEYTEPKFKEKIPAPQELPKEVTSASEISRNKEPEIQREIEGVEEAPQGENAVQREKEVVRRGTGERGENLQQPEEARAGAGGKEQLKRRNKPFTYTKYSGDGEQSVKSYQEYGGYKIVKPYKGMFEIIDDSNESVGQYAGVNGAIAEINRRNEKLTKFSTKKVTQTPQFKKWFGKSKVVDEKGEPLVVYHGTQSEFSKFDKNKIGKNDSGFFGTGYYFSSDAETSNAYAGESSGASVLPTYLNVENPYIWPDDRQAVATKEESDNVTKELIEEGYDGVIYNMKPFLPGDKGKNMQEIVVFSPTQIKSATGNTGAFDPNNPDIRYSQKQKTEQPKRLSKKEIESVFKNQKVTPNEDGSFSIGDLTVQQVPEIVNDEYAFKANYKREKAPGEQIVGSYEPKTKTIRITPQGDKFTLHHESYHHLESSGLINNNDRRILNHYVRKQGKEATEENRARYVESELRKRHAAKPLQRVMQKIADFIDALVNIAKRTGRGVIRDIESGRMARGIEAPNLRNQRGQVDVWHGSPHSFEKFESDKIGSGEGAQAFGHGIYFTDQDSIAKYYANRLSSFVNVKVDGEFVWNLDWLEDNTPPELALRAIAFEKGIDSGLKSIDRLAKQDDDYKKAGEWVRKNRDRISVEGNRNLYKVTLHKGKDPSEYSWLDWEEPVKNELLNKIVSQWDKEFPESQSTSRIKERMSKNLPIRDEGRNIYHGISEDLGSDKDASMFLLRAGIDGIRYPAGTLSGGGKGTNYVVFDPEAITIEEHIQYSTIIQDTLQTSKGTIKNLRKNWANNKQDISALDRIVSLMSHFSDKVPALRKMFDAGLKRMDNFHSIFNSITETDGKESLILKLRQFQKENKAEYEKLQDYLIEHDQKQIGYRVHEQNGNWVVMDLKNEKPLAELKTEQDAVRVSMKMEASDLKKAGYSDQAIDSLLSVRTITNNAFDILAQGMREVIAKADKVPRIKLKGGISISLQEALSEMGDMRSFYMPRIRKPGQHMIKATKEGESSILEFRPNLVSASLYQTRLQKKGYKVTISNAPVLPEDIFDLAGKVIATQNLIFEALKKTDKEIVKSGELKDLLKRTEGIFATSLIDSVSDIYKARGHRAHMIRRSLDVWEGYEKDPLTALTKYARGISYGEAKKKMALELIRAFTGTDESWDAYKQRNGKDAKYEDYLQQVRERMIDPVSQRNAHKEGLSYMKEMLRNQEAVDRVIGTIKGVAVLKYLAGRVSAPVVNLTALVTSVPATMHGYAGINKRSVPKYLKDAANTYRKWRWGDGKIDKWSRQAIEHIKQEGWDNAQYNSEALSVLRSRVGKTWDYAIDKSMAAFGASEKVNRISTILGTYMGIKDQHKGEWTFQNHLDALKKAKETSDKAHGIYNKANYPSWARGGNPAAQIARMFYVFRTFSHNYLLTMKDLGFKIGPYKVGKGQNSDFLFMAFSPAIIGGAGASVFTPFISKILGRLIGSDDAEEDFYRWLEQNYGNSASQWARYGVSGIGGHGVSLKGSLAIGIGDIPTSLADLAGAPGSVISDVWTGGENIIQGNVTKGLEKMLPLFASNVLKGVREATEGVTTRTNAPVFYGREQLKGTVTDAIYRSLSFNPARLAGIREKQWKERIRGYRLTEKRTDIYAKIKRFYLQPVRKRTKGKWANILLEIQEYNDIAKRRGESQITEKSIKRVLKRAFRPNKRERTRN